MTQHLHPPDSPAKGAVRLPGSDLALDQTARKADLIIVGTVAKVDPVDPSADGLLHYHVVIRVFRVLKGHAPGRELPAHFIRRTLRQGEAAPEHETPYIFLLQFTTNTLFEAIKIVPLSEEANLGLGPK